MHNLMRRYRHLTDEQLLTLIESASGDAHLAVCDRCADRHAELLCAIGDLDALHAEADAVFDEHRLSRQHAQILRHIDHNHGPARVLHFPALSTTAPRVHTLGRRWVAAAAIAGLVVGLLAGWRLDHEALGARQTAIATETRNVGRQFTPVRGAIVPADNRKTLNDERLLVEVDAAVARPRVKELTAIDALTPSAR